MHDLRLPETTKLSRSLGRIAITGATGFIGKRLVEAMLYRGIRVSPLVRSTSGDARAVAVDLSEPETLNEALKDIEVVVHCAGYAHAHQEVSDSVDQTHQLINCTYAVNTAYAAARAGVRRFVFCSSVKAVGEPGELCVDESHVAEPETSYGRAKRAAERGLSEISAATGMEVVVLRLTMVYGDGSRGNLERMLRLVAGGWFPPLPDTGNKRSMVHVADVVDALILAASHPSAAGRTYIVAHPHAVSGRALYQQMRSSWSLPPTRWAVPAWLLRTAGKGGDLISRILRRRMPWDSQTADRLLNSAHYSAAALHTELGWAPRVELSEGLKDMIRENYRPRLDWKRPIDLVLALFAAIVVIVPCAFIALLIRTTSAGPALYWSKRVGKDNALFDMPKFRTMHIGTPAVATHLLTNADKCITPLGKLLRKTSLDELPQIWSVLKGDMSFVGPRPALFNQHDLVALRAKYGVHHLRPGITGWAQINGRDELSIDEKVQFDRQYLERRGLALDLEILAHTALQVVKRHGIAH